MCNMLLLRSSLANLIMLFAGKIEHTASQLTQAFNSKDLEEAKSLAVQLQYWDNIRRAIVDWVPGKRIEIQH
jgi:molecular chaperone HscB